MGGVADSCTLTAGGLIVDSQGTELLQPYPAEGFPLPQEGLTLSRAPLPLPLLFLILLADFQTLTNPPHPPRAPPPDYGQRSLENCYAKVDVLERNPWDWRTKWGKKGCARDFIPNDEQLGNVDAFEGDAQGEWAMQREEGVEEGLMGDVGMRDSWEGRMVRVLMDEWEVRGRGRRGTERGQGDEIPNVVPLKP